MEAVRALARDSVDQIVREMIMICMIVIIIGGNNSTDNANDTDNNTDGNNDDNENIDLN